MCGPWEGLPLALGLGWIYLCRRRLEGQQGSSARAPGLAPGPALGQQAHQGGSKAAEQQQACRATRATRAAGQQSSSRAPKPALLFARLQLGTKKPCHDRGVCLYIKKTALPLCLKHRYAMA